MPFLPGAGAGAVAAAGAAAAARRAPPDTSARASSPPITAVPTQIFFIAMPPFAALTHGAPLPPSCCCPSKAAPETSSPVLKAADCCNPEISQRARLEAEAVRPADHDPVQLVTALVGAASVPSLVSPSERPAPAWQRHGPA